MNRYIRHRYVNACQSMTSEHDMGKTPDGINLGSPVGCGVGGDRGDARDSGVSRRGWGRVPG